MNILIAGALYILSLALAFFGVYMLDIGDTHKIKASYAIFWPLWVVVAFVWLAIWTIRAMWNVLAEK